MSESNHGTVGKAFPGWIRINEHLHKIAHPENCSFSTDIDRYISRVGKGSWKNRQSKQLHPLHCLACVLTPDHRPSWYQIDAIDRNSVKNFLDDYGNSDPAILQQFFDYGKRAEV